MFYWIWGSTGQLCSRNAKARLIRLIWKFCACVTFKDGDTSTWSPPQYSGVHTLNLQQLGPLVLGKACLVTNLLCNLDTRHTISRHVWWVNIVYFLPSQTEHSHSWIMPHKNSRNRTRGVSPTRAPLLESVLEYIPCAHVNSSTRLGCPNGGKLVCGRCQLVRYCSKASCYVISASSPITA